MTWWLFLLAGLIPLIVGSVYYHPKVMGTAWMNSNGFTLKDLEGGNMPMIFGLAYLCSVLIAVAMMPMTIHQMGYMSVMMEVDGYGVAGSEVSKQVEAFTKQYADVSRNFGHGAFHGMLYTIFLVVPIISINALFERRSLKYVLVHGGYWLITLALMGGVIAQFMVIG